MHHQAIFPPNLGALLVSLESEIETRGLWARWEFGHEILKQRKGTIMPRGLLNAIGKMVGATRGELRKRLRFAERYPTEKELCRAIKRFPSWFSMVRYGLGRVPSNS